MKADHTPPDRLPEALRRQLMEEEPEASEELERVWQLIDGADPRPVISEEETEAIWRRVSERVESSTHRLPVDRAPTRRIRRRTWAVGTLATAVIIATLVFISVPVRWHAPAGERRAVTLPDGSTVELNGGTTLTYARGFGSDTRRVHLDGEAFFSVVADGRPFEVETFNAVIHVLGTAFNVKSRASSPSADTRVAVVSGHVRMMPGDIDLTARQSAWITSGALPARVRVEEDIDLVLQWRDRGFSVLNEPLEAAFLQLEWQFGVDIDVTVPLDPQRQVVYYRSEPSVELLLSDLCVAHGLQFRKTAAGFEVFR
jgi:ferric-dicitrate binding protein FerR (iron transport regulator)